jgi:hypothetical protein
VISVTPGGGTEAAVVIARPFTLLLVAATACAPAIALDHGDAERMRSASSIRVAWVAAGGADVECPSDEGVKTWEYPGSRWEAPAAPGFPPVREARTTPSGAPVLLASGGTWESIVGQWTESIRHPPVDPAEATARAFLADARGRAGGAAWAGPPVEIRSPSSPRPAGADLVVVVEARRFVLLGCYFRFSPWFDVRATLVDPSTGRALWRASCREDVPPGAGPERWPSELAADGGALYAREIEARAATCAAHLSRALWSAEPSPVQGTTGSR